MLTHQNRLFGVFPKIHQNLGIWSSLKAKDKTTHCQKKPCNFQQSYLGSWWRECLLPDSYLAIFSFYKLICCTKELIILFLDALASLDFTLVSRSVGRSVIVSDLGAQNHMILNFCLSSCQQVIMSSWRSNCAVEQVEGRWKNIQILLRRGSTLSTRRSSMIFWINSVDPFWPLR